MKTVILKKIVTTQALEEVEVELPLYVKEPFAIYKIISEDTAVIVIDGHGISQTKSRDRIQAFLSMEPSTEEEFENAFNSTNDLIQKIKAA